MATLEVEALVTAEADGGKQSGTVPLTPPHTPVTLTSPATPPAWGWSVQAQEPLLTFHAHTLTDPGLEKLSGVSWVPAHS